MKLIAQGAEAKLFKDNNQLIKHRIKKDYRIDEIDEKLRKQRTRKEAKILYKLSEFGFTPKPISPEKKKIKKATDKITMDFIDGITLRDCLNKKNYKKLATELAQKIAILHNKNIIHGDLTTSNFIYKNKIYIIDFGLSYESTKVEDKAVDLHLLHQALKSKHSEFYKEMFNEFLKVYKKQTTNSKQILERLDKVSKRGRYKKK
jgi:TP53 regulating kinase and related kinases